MNIVLIILFLLVFFVFFLHFVLSFFYAGPYLPIPKSILSDLFSKYPLDSAGVFYDLGSGDGRVLRYVSKTYGVKAIGIEIQLMIYLLSIFLNTLFHSEEITIYRNSYFNIDLSDADYVFLHMMPHGIKLLEKKLLKELKPGAKVLSYGNTIEGFWYVKSVELSDTITAGIFPKSLYVYEKR